MIHRWLHIRIFSGRNLGDWSRRWAGVVVLPVILLSIPLLVVSVTPPAQTSAGKPQPSAPPAKEKNRVEVSLPPRVVDVSLQQGDTLGSILSSFDLDPRSAHELIKAVRPFFNPRKMRAGESLQLFLDPRDNTVQGLEYLFENDALIRVTSVSEGWSAERKEIPFVRNTRVVRGKIDDNLYENGTGAGLTPLQILELASVFEYDIDFFSDFRKGDTFTVALEDIHYADGRRVAGRILAAELEAGGEPFSAFYYADKDGKGAYYDSDGRTVRRAFLRAPLSYRRISSRYSLRRRDPISRTLRPHRAIDYAAPAGTPVVSIGRGKVTYAGWRSGYGRLVEVRHSNGYVTRYAHFSRIARGIRKGKYVAQGDVVGYVGQSGHATGPHLHFELLRQGRKINFLSMRFPRANRLKGVELDRFGKVRDEQLALLRSDGAEIAQAVP
jgi:murein DD-endopeptidase MepM/ murein hydrolase activator NlpD